VQGIEAQVEPATRGPGQPVQARLDAEMVALARNAVRFQALAQGMSRHLGLLALAAGDGRR
jgi:flagellar basal-body rod protein FlgB